MENNSIIKEILRLKMAEKFLRRISKILKSRNKREMGMRVGKSASNFAYRSSTLCENNIDLKIFESNVDVLYSRIFSNFEKLSRSKFLNYIISLNLREISYISRILPFLKK